MRPNTRKRLTGLGPRACYAAERPATAARSDCVCLHSAVHHAWFTSALFPAYAAAAGSYARTAGVASSSHAVTVGSNFCRRGRQSPHVLGRACLCSPCQGGDSELQAHKHMRGGNGMHLGDLRANPNGGGGGTCWCLYCWRHRSHPGMYHRTVTESLLPH